MTIGFKVPQKLEAPQCTKLYCCYGALEEGHDEGAAPNINDIPTETLIEESKRASKLTKEKLFVYGIFLDWHNRQSRGMTGSKYAVVKDYTTVSRGSGSIVMAVKVENSDLGLTGLLVDMPVEGWESLDELEWGYERVRVKTATGDRAWMYAAPNRGIASERKMSDGQAK